MTRVRRAPAGRGHGTRAPVQLFSPLPGTGRDGALPPQLLDTGLIGKRVPA